MKLPSRLVRLTRRMYMQKTVSEVAGSRMADVCVETGIRQCRLDRPFFSLGLEMLIRRDS